jgi:hypothetical protein
VQRLNMLSNTAEQKAYVTPTVIYGAVRLPKTYPKLISSASLQKSSAPLSQLVFNNEGRFRYGAGRITCIVTGMVASLY